MHHGATRLYGFNGNSSAIRFIRRLIWRSDRRRWPWPVCRLCRGAFGFVISIQLIVQHSNVDAALGPLRNHISIGQIHHLHHVNWGKDGDVNFGLFSTVWDRLLGTFTPEPPRPIRANDLGIDEVPDPTAYRAHLAFPRLIARVWTPRTRRRAADPRR